MNIEHVPSLTVAGGEGGEQTVPGGLHCLGVEGGEAVDAGVVDPVSIIDDHGVRSGRELVREFRPWFALGRVAVIVGWNLEIARREHAVLVGLHPGCGAGSASRNRLARRDGTGDDVAREGLARKETGRLELAVSGIHLDVTRRRGPVDAECVDGERVAGGTPTSPPPIFIHHDVVVAGGQAAGEPMSSGRPAAESDGRGTGVREETELEPKPGARSGEHSNRDVLRPDAAHDEAVPHVLTEVARRVPAVVVR